MAVGKCLNCDHVIQFIANYSKDEMKETILYGSPATPKICKICRLQTCFVCSGRDDFCCPGCGNTSYIEATFENYFNKPENEISISKEESLLHEIEKKALVKFRKFPAYFELGNLKAYLKESTNYINADDMETALEVLKDAGAAIRHKEARAEILIRMAEVQKMRGFTALADAYLKDALLWKTSIK